MRNGSIVSQIVLLFCFVFQAVVAPARATTVLDCGGYTIVYGNGIMNTQDDYEDGRKTLEELFGRTHDGLPISYANAIDYTQGFWTDLLAVMHQEVQTYDEDGLTWPLAIQIFLGIEPSGTSLTLIDLLHQAIQQVVITATSFLLNLFTDNEAHIASTVGEHVELYEEAILMNEQRVLVVGHSQGTLYANTAFTTLMNNPDIPPKSIAIVDVAALVVNVADGQNRYVTSSGDMAVASLRAVINSFALPSNIDLPFNHDDVLGHNFVSTYLAAGSASETLVVSQGLQALDSLENVEWTIEQSLSSLKYEGNQTVPVYIPDGSGGHQIFDASMEYGYVGPDFITQWGMSFIDFVYFQNQTQSVPIHGLSPTGTSQTYRDAKGAAAEASIFADALNNPPLFAALRSLDEFGISPANGSITFAFISRPHNFPGHEDFLTASHAGVTIDTLASTYDREMLDPWADWLISNYPAARSVKTLEDWPNKRVRIRVCPTRGIPES